MFSHTRQFRLSSRCSQRPARVIGPLAAGMLGLSMLSGCVVTGATMQAPGAGQVPAPAAHAANAGAILISEGDLKERSYLVLGEISAWGRSFNLVSSNPTRADVDEALRAQAARLGADAVILVRYRSAKAGLASRGKLTAQGQAVVFKG
jgi:hypothetical protein